MILLLFLLLPTLVFTDEPAAPVDPWANSHGWARHCGTLSRCFCVRAPGGKLEEIDATDPKPDCNIGLQVRYFTQERVLFRLRVYGDTTAVGANSNAKLMLYYGAQNKPTIARPLFGCWMEKGKVIIKGESDYTKHKLKLFEDRSKFEKENAVCEFTADRADIFMTSVPNDLDYPYIKLEIDSNTVVTAEGENDGFSRIIKKGKIACDPYLFKDTAPTEGLRAEPLFNKDKDVLNCANYGPSYTMKSHVFESGVQSPIIGLECKKDLLIADTYSYFIIEDLGDRTKDVPVTAPETYAFFCTAPLSETCADPFKYSCRGKPDCPIFKEGAHGRDAKLTCENKKWIIDGEYYELEVEPVCKEDSMEPIKSAAFYTQIDNTERKTEGGTCFKDYDCLLKSKLNYPDCDKNAAVKCGVMLYTDGIMKCEDPARKLIIKNYDTSEERVVANATCNKATGQWQISFKGVEGIIEEKSRVRCIQEIEPDKTSTMSRETLIYTVCGIVGGGIAIALLVLGLIYFAFIYEMLNNPLSIVPIWRMNAMPTCEAGYMTPTGCGLSRPEIEDSNSRTVEPYFRDKYTSAVFTVVFRDSKEAAIDSELYGHVNMGVRQVRCPHQLKSAERAARVFLKNSPNVNTVFVIIETHALSTVDFDRRTKKIEKIRTTINLLGCENRQRCSRDDSDDSHMLLSKVTQMLSGIGYDFNVDIIVLFNGCRSYQTNLPPPVMKQLLKLQESGKDLDLLETLSTSRLAIIYAPSLGHQAFGQRNWCPHREKLLNVAATTTDNREVVSMFNEVKTKDKKWDRYINPTPLSNSQVDIKPTF